MHTDVRLWKGLLFIDLSCREGDYNEFLCHLQGLCDLYQLSRDTWVIYTVINIFFLKISLPIFTCMCCLLHVPLKFSFKNDVESWWFSWVSWYFYFLSSLSAWHWTGTLSSIENCTVIIIIIFVNWCYILIVWLFRSSDFKNQRFLQPSKQWKPILIQWQHSLGNDYFLSLILIQWQHSLGNDHFLSLILIQWQHSLGNDHFLSLILIQWQHSLGNDYFLSLIMVVEPNGF